MVAHSLDPGAGEMVGNPGANPAEFTSIAIQVLTSVITATPFRLSFFGGGTDFPGYFNRRGGLVVAAAMRQFAYVALNCLERLLERRFRVSYSRLEMVDRIADIQHDIVRAVLSEYIDLIGESFVDLHSYADLPARSGVGSSSAFTVGLLSALHALNGRYIPPKALARQAIRIEREVLNEAGGWQDQITASCGGFNVVEFGDNDFEVQPLVVGAARRAAIEALVLAVFHLHHPILGLGARSCVFGHEHHRQGKGPGRDAGPGPRGGADFPHHDR